MQPPLTKTPTNQCAPLAIGKNRPQVLSLPTAVVPRSVPWSANEAGAGGGYRGSHVLTMAEPAVTGPASSSEVGIRHAWPGLREGCGLMPLQLCAPARQALLRLQGQCRLPTGLYAQTLLFDIGEHLHHG